MKILNPIRFALLAAAALVTHAAFAAKPGPNPPPPSSGTLVLDYTYLGNPNSAENFGMTVAPSGTIYSSGNAYVEPRSIAADASGHLFVGSGSEEGFWLVKKY